MTTNNISAGTSRRRRTALCLALGAACLAVARPSPAQQAVELHPNIGWSPTRVQARVSGANPNPRTPEMQAQLDRIQSLNHAAAVALHAGDYATAEADARASIAVGQDSGVAEEVLAQSLEFQGKDQEALQEYQKPVLCGSVINAARNGLPYALLLLKAGQWSQALAVYQKTLPLVSEQGIAIIWPRWDGTSRTVPLVSEQGGTLMPQLSSVTFSPDDPQPVALEAAIHVARGLTYNGGCDWAYNSQDDKALVEYQKALQLAPDWDIANFYHGYGLKYLGRKAEAKAAFAKAAQLGGDDVKAAVKRFSP